MSKFTIEELYRVNRVDYCRLSGVTPGDLITHLQAEIMMLNRSLEAYRQEYREGGHITTDEQRRRSAIIYEIRDKIDAKTSKVDDIKREFSLR